jgi:predicted nucleotidyltransferase
MSVRRFSVPGYAHLYRSLLRFTGMSGRDAKELVYLLNTANLDSVRYVLPREYVAEAGPVTFSRWMDRMSRRPYRTEVQLYKALAALRHNIIREAITDRQREAAARLRCTLRDLEFHFYMTFGMDIDDILTVYADCAFGLVPREDEPSVCLMDDWLSLPSA